MIPVRGFDDWRRKARRAQRDGIPPAEVSFFSEEDGQPLPVPDLAASFQAAVTDVLFTKTMKAAQAFGAKEILVAGGVSANKALREAFLGQTQYKVHIPQLSLCTDNAAMIAAAGYFRFVHGQRDPLSLDVLPTWPLS